MALLRFWPENATNQVSKARAGKLCETKIDLTFGQLWPILKCIFIRHPQFWQLIKVQSRFVPVVCNAD